jgi:hypothetical protein
MKKKAVIAALMLEVGLGAAHAQQVDPLQCDEADRMLHRAVMGERNASTDSSCKISLFNRINLSQHSEKL